MRASCPNCNSSTFSSTRLAGSNSVPASATCRRSKCTTLDLFGKRNTECGATLIDSANTKGLNNAANNTNLRMSRLLSWGRN
ncbi:hypothetical protein D3C71_2102650 [compost metagenome]